jgi:hypothetical protein
VLVTATIVLSLPTTFCNHNSNRTRTKSNDQTHDCYQFQLSQILVLDQHHLRPDRPIGAKDCLSPGYVCCWRSTIPEPHEVDAIHA